MTVSKKGFTLIELLVVILIIGILAAVALPQYNRAVWKSRFIQAKTLARHIANSEEVYYTVNSSYTNDFTLLDIDLTPATYTEVYGVENSKAQYDWGYCILHTNGNRQEVHCVIRKSAKDYLRYVLEFYHGNYFMLEGIGKSRCVAYGNDDKPKPGDLNYQLCSEDTHNSNPKIFGGYSLSWEYKN